MSDSVSSDDTTLNNVDLSNAFEDCREETSLKDDLKSLQKKISILARVFSSLAIFLRVDE